MIESVNNDRVKMWAKLNDKKYQSEVQKFLVEGEHLVEEANASGNLLEVLVLSGYELDYENVTIVSEAVMKKISNLTSVPRIIGIARMITPRDIRGNVLLLDGVQDPGNMGTIIRSAVAFGIDTIVLGEGTVSIYNPKVVRASEGLIFHMNFVEASIERVIPELKAHGYKIFSSKVDGGRTLSEIEFAEQNAFIVGSEGRGVRPSLGEMCDEYLYIPMDSKCESLNVGVATSIILYELNR